MSDIEHVSVTQVRQWQRCQYQYYLGRVLRLPGKHNTKMLLGIGVHAAIAQANLYRQRGVEPDMEYLLEIYHKALEDELAVREYALDDLAEVQRRGQKIIRSVVKELDQISGLPLYVEHPIELDWEGVRILGRIDLVDKDGTIYDFKIGSRPKGQADVDRDLQLSIYRYAVHGDSEEPTTVNIVNVNNRTGEVSVVRSTRTGKDVQAACSVVSAVAKQIRIATQTDVYVPNTEGWWCSADYCEHYVNCPYGGVVK